MGPGVDSERILDELLVASARIGDAAARTLLVRRWDKRLLAHAVRLTDDRDGAREAVQDSWVEILRGLQRLRDDRAFPAWAYRITTRRCARLVHQVQRDRLKDSALAASAIDEPAAFDGFCAAEGERLRAAIRALPPQQRAAIALFYFDELSVAEVAVALDVPAGTAKTRLMHARNKLRAALEGE